MTEYRFTPQGDRKNALVFLGVSIFVALLGLVLNAFSIQPLIGQILFFLGAVVVVMILMRWFFSSYTYVLTADGYFEILYSSGKRVMPVASFFLRDIVKAKEIQYRERPKKAVAMQATMFPEYVLAIYAMVNGSETVLLLEADKSFHSELLRRIGGNREENRQ